MILWQVLYHVIIDKDYSRALVLEGFTFSFKRKRDIMHELEAIIKSVEIVKR
jgi:hypothetical protein